MCHESYTTNPDSETYEWLPVLRPLQFRIYCDVLERHDQGDGDPTYTVRMHLEDGGSIDVQNVDGSGIFLYDKAYSQDWHLPNAFRHEMMIPDDVMPEAWLNGPPEEVFAKDEQ